MNKKIDIKSAHASYSTPNHIGGGLYIPHPDNSMDYSCAYVISNEELRFTTGLTADRAKRVLTITGSGDQALFYALAGATHIDTFDVTYCARAIMDIKTTAIGQLNLGQYGALLSSLHKNPHCTSVENMQGILQKMPQQSAGFIRDMDNYYIFGNGLAPEYYPDHMFNDQEYKKLKSKIKAPFNFIWSDAMHVHEHLTMEYDVINLSNIFEWAPQTTIPTLESLRKHIRVGGHIIAQTSSAIKEANCQEYIRAQEKFKNWAKIGKIQDFQTREIAVILQRTK